MLALFIALGIAVITLLVLLLWFVPHLLHQQAVRSAQEAADLRGMLLSMLNEQEAVMVRQAQLSTAIADMQNQLEQIVETTRGTAGLHAQPPSDDTALRTLEERIVTIQDQIQGWLDMRTRTQRNNLSQDNEAWANLMSLLAAIQERVGLLSTSRMNTTISFQAHALIEDLEKEMEHLRAISDDITTLQWRLRRSLSEREHSAGASHQNQLGMVQNRPAVLDSLSPLPAVGVRGPQAP